MILSAHVTAVPWAGPNIAGLPNGALNCLTASLDLFYGRASYGCIQWVAPALVCRHLVPEYHSTNDRIPTAATLAGKPCPECGSHRHILKDASLTQAPLLISLPFETCIGLFARAYKAIKSNEQAEVISRVRAVRLFDGQFVSAMVLQHVLNKLR